MSNKRVLQIITLSEFGGAQKHINQLIEYGSAVFAVACGGSGEAFKNIPAKVYPCSGLKRSINPFYDFLAFFQLLKVIKDFQPDVVHCHSSKAGVLGRLAAKLSGVKSIIYTVHGFVFKEPGNAVKKRIMYFIEYVMAKMFTDKLICVSREDYLLAKQFKKQTYYIPNGIDFNKYKPSKQQSKTLQGVCIANFYKNKGHDILIEALADLRKYNFSIDLIGKDGGELVKIKKLVKKYKLDGRVRFSGFKKIEPVLLSKYNFLVLTSHKEGFPYVVLEALGMGLTVIATAVGGVPELLGKGQGIICRPGDLKEIKKALLTVFLGKKININRAFLQKNYSIQMLVTKITDLY